MGDKLLESRGKKPALQVDDQVAVSTRCGDFGAKNAGVVRAVAESPDDKGRYFVGVAMKGRPDLKDDRLPFFEAGLLEKLALALAIALGALVTLGLVDGDDALALALLANAPAAVPAPARWARREPLHSFQNVDASQVAAAIIPRWDRTVRGITLELGGTTFAKSDLSRIEIFLGSKSIWGPVSGTELRRVNQYEHGPAGDHAKFLNIDFTLTNLKEIAHEQVSGLDLSSLPSGDVRLECEIGSGASAPSLKANVYWGNPEGSHDKGTLMSKLVKRTYPEAAAGDFMPPVDMRGAIVVRQFMGFTVIQDGTATAVTGNTGNGAMGTVTVTKGTRTGKYTLEVVEPGANVGQFIVRDPDGVLISKGVVASAFSAGGLAFTLADGGTDFVAGDAFEIVVGNTSMNLNNVEIKKNNDVWWNMNERAARIEANRRGRFTYAGIYVADFLLDNHFDGRLHTNNAKTLDYKLNLTAADTVDIISHVLARPLQL